MLSLAGAALTAALAGPLAPPARTVELRAIAFSPRVLRIRPGQRVTWRWNDGPHIPHDLRSTGAPRFAGSAARKTGTHTVRFFRAGTYRYVCTIHAGMTGRVIVRAR